MALSIGENRVLNSITIHTEYIFQLILFYIVILVILFKKIRVSSVFCLLSENSLLLSKISNFLLISKFHYLFTTIHYIFI